MSFATTKSNEVDDQFKSEELPQPPLAPEAVAAKIEDETRGLINLDK